jgi:hypothetical protein
MNRRDILLSVGTLGLTGMMTGCTTTPSPATPSTTVWTFDRLDAIAGHPTTIEGAPFLIDGPGGKAVKFDGEDDALFIDNHPLAGAARFTFEAVFRPDGGAFEQRWFHLQEYDAVSQAQGQPPGTRFLFEIRVEGNEWWLDAFIKGPGYNQVLIFPEKRHPIGQWFHVAQTYDGTTYRAYVDGELQGQAVVAFTPQGAGRSSVGCRMNRVNYFNGAIREARFTPLALSPQQFSQPG